MDESVTQELLCAQAETQESLSRLRNFNCELLLDVPKKTAPASQLHLTLLRRLRRAFEAKARGQGKEKLSIKEGMKLAGASEQLYQQWKNGASPKLITLETMAGNLELTIHQLLGGQRVVFASEESAEIAAFVDPLPEEARAHIRDTAKSLAIMYRSGAIQPKTPAKT